MKTTAKLIAIAILLGAGTWLTTEKAQAQGWSHYEVFHHELSPYGTWITSPQYGLVWVPNVSPGFHPYSTSGYWVNTVYGWTWISYYPWGWAPFHYGRWYFDNWNGWVWVPGTEWGPAWVSWSYCDGYYGWAPLTPGFHFSMDVHIIPVHHWIFVHGRHFGDRHMANHYMGRRDNDRLYHHAKPILTTSVDNERNTRYFSGPEVKEVRKASGRDFKPVAAREERGRIGNKRTTPPQNRMIPEKTERYTPIPAERKLQAPGNTRSESIKISKERTNVQTGKIKNDALVKSGNGPEISDRRTPSPRQQAETKPKPGNRPPAARTTERPAK